MIWTGHDYGVTHSHHDSSLGQGRCILHQGQWNKTTLSSYYDQQLAKTMTCSLRPSTQSVHAIRSGAASASGSPPASPEARGSADLAEEVCRQETSRVNIDMTVSDYSQWSSEGGDHTSQTKGDSGYCATPPATATYCPVL